MKVRTRYLPLLAVLLLVGCRGPLDVPAALAVTDVTSGWFDAGLDNLGRHKIVPSVTFRVANTTPEIVRHLQINAIFRRQGEEEEWGNAYVRVVGTEGIEAGEASQVLRLDSGRGYTGEQTHPEMLQHRDFVDVTIDLFVKHRGDQWALLDSVDINRRILAQ